MQTFRYLLEECSTLVLVEFETENWNKRCWCWSSSLRYIDGSQLALDKLKDFWKHDMQVVLKQVIGTTVTGLTVGFAALKLAGYILL